MPSPYWLHQLPYDLGGCWCPGRKKHHAMPGHGQHSPKEQCVESYDLSARQEGRSHEAVRVLGQALARHISPEAGKLPPFALGDAPGLAAEVATAGFAGMTVQTASRLLRYDSPEEFARTYLISTPLADLLAQVEETRRTALLADVSAALQPYIDGSGLAFPSESQIIIARK